jgi:hypothetical protein
MDASKITELLQIQNNRIINRNRTVDSSTLLWEKQIQSSTYIAKQNQLPVSQHSADKNGIACYGGQGKDTTLATGATQRYPNVYAGSAGSGSQIYSSDIITLQKAGQNACAAPINISNGANSFITLPICVGVGYCSNTNVPSTINPIINNQSNPYLPIFDTYYKMKTPCNGVPMIVTNTPKGFSELAKCPPPVINNNQSY